MHLKDVEPVAGGLLMLLLLADVFLTVLYARVGTGLFSVVVAKSLWRVFREVSRPLGERRGSFLSEAFNLSEVAGLVAIWPATNNNQTFGDLMLESRPP